MQPLEILSQYFGYSHFRRGQEELIEQLLGGRDVLGIMPTGAGKSVCYQVPAMVFEGVTLVVSPLISLMKDQVDTLSEMGIPAHFINSTQSGTTYRQVIQNAMEGQYKLLYVAPERLESYEFLELCQQMPIAMIAIDEAHCVSQWGHDFRPSYRYITTFLRKLPTRPVIGAFTATATPRVKNDIQKLLALEEPYVLTTGFDRPNLYFEVDKPKKRYEWLLNFLRQRADESGICYCTTRKTVDALAEKLEAQGFKVTKYHAGLSESIRSQNQEDFIFDRKPLMIATNAFGMGIDKSNIRFVIHCNMPKDLESYYQEAGRAGRDGLPAQCILLYSAADTVTNKMLIEMGSHSGTHQQEYEKLRQMEDFCNTEECLRHEMLAYFGEAPTAACGHCSNCNSTTEQTDITVEAQKILSCTKRMKERFGMIQVIDVLRGANTQKIRELGFESLTTYGIMREYSKDTLKQMIGYLVAEKYLALIGNKFPVLALTESAYEVLKGNQTILMRIRLQEEQAYEDVMQDLDKELLIQLKEVRQQLAQTQNVPPFMIFSDSTLHEMACYYPTQEDEFLMISGVGQLKHQRYGEAFMTCVRDYVLTHQVIKPPLEAYYTKPSRIKETGVKRTAGDTVMETYRLYEEGMSIQDIAKVRDLSTNTIENHLVKCIEQGLIVDVARFATPEEQELILKAVEKVGTGLLKPIKEQLPEHITYTAIKIVIAQNHMFDA
ncbi:MAG: DNA helicase RecQ [Cellulosilyticaceae bacterium]